MSGPRHVYRVLGIGAVAMAVTMVCPFLGIRYMTIRAVLESQELRYIFCTIRIPRTLAAFVAGGGLALAGMVYQALFRNPLASPYTLGVSGGASLGAALCIALGAGGSMAGFSMVSMGSFAGAVGAVVLVYTFAWSRESNSITLLLAGVVVATVCSGLIMFIHYLSPLRHSFQIMRWIMGGVDGATYAFLAVMAVPVMLYAGVCAAFMPQLDQFLTGDSLAHSRGVAVRRSRNMFIVVTALAVGAIVSACGPIGFVGIMAPHACRLMLGGARHRVLGVCSFLLGGAFLVVSDTLARTLAPPSEIPVGILTALFGGPFFLAILFRRKGRLQF
ncbi:MAG: iron chelate uptake ABC transporter family permease subunit [Chitinivibrionales bacterium]|nr:iron chelate uptake ABC transporter family permease subunit [Chitinivibrionales bacterium]MBD3395541.1 iron chelate uptake ABC transporter family permease subunit [Chitinivibrionales bacterium]